MTMITYILATLLVCILIALSCMMSVTVSTKRRFKKYQRAVKKPRGAVISSPLLHDALFSLKEEHISFWATEVEHGPDVYV